MKYLFFFTSFFIVSLYASIRVKAIAQNGDYTEGVFFVNEDWYSHRNGSVNFLTDEGEWIYRIFQKENSGKELGCTTQYGTIYGDKFYLVSKQERDPGAQVTGSRLTVCDAKTMKCLKEFPYIAVNSQGKSIADGRSFVGVSEKKGYIGTSNGIWVYDIEKMEIGRQIEGTGNPDSSDYGQLYYAQVGTMLRTQNYVFAVHQQYGLLVIDPEKDVVVKTISPPTYIDYTDDKDGKEESRGFGSIVQSKDGNLWISMAGNIFGDGSTLPHLLKMNPYTFEVDTITIPHEEGIEDIPNSWYAWTADGFCASMQENKIYWNGNNGDSWFKGRRMFCYDIDNKHFSKVFDFEHMVGNWILYGAGFRLHPVTDEIYCSLFHNFQDPTYQAVRISTTGKLLAEYPMITDYWFPAMPVFPDIYSPEINISELTVGNEGSFVISLTDKITDKDNPDVAILKSVSSISTPDLFTAEVINGNLVITSIQGQTGAGKLTLKVNSNGKIAEKEIPILITAGSTIETSTHNYKIYSYDRILQLENCQGYTVQLYDRTGTCVHTIYVDTDNFFMNHELPQGIYIYRGIRNNHTINGKIGIK